jgi:hypothetical protein
LICDLKRMTRHVTCKADDPAPRADAAGAADAAVQRSQIVEMEMNAVLTDGDQKVSHRNSAFRPHLFHPELRWGISIFKATNRWMSRDRRLCAALSCCVLVEARSITNRRLVDRYMKMMDGLL